MRAFNWGSQEGEDKHGTRLGTPVQILDTPWQKQKYAMYWNIKLNSINHLSFRYLDTYNLKTKAILDLMKWPVINFAPLT